MKKLAIFDLDGTLLYTLEDLHASTNFALESEGLPARSLDEVRCFVGNGIRKLIERAVPDGCAPDVTDRVFAAFKRHYAENCMVLTRPYPGIPEMLDALKASNALAESFVFIALTSNLTKNKPRYCSAMRSAITGLCYTNYSVVSSLSRNPLMSSVCFQVFRVMSKLY